MKILLILLLILAAPSYLKAQDATLGKSKEQIRAMIKPNSGISLLRGEDCDTLTMQGAFRYLCTTKTIFVIPLKVSCP
jgi:hypothetical protein